MAKSIWITGHNGFIGKNAVEYFADEGYRIFTYDEDLTHLNPDKRPEGWPEHLDYILHLAAKSPRTSEKSLLKINRTINNRVCDLWQSQYYQAKFLTLNSHLAYDAGTNVMEESLYTGFPFLAGYGTAKRELCSSLRNQNATIYTVGNVFGPNDVFAKNSQLVTSLCYQALKEGQIELQTDGSERRSFLHVDTLLRYINNTKDMEFDDNLRHVMGRAMHVYQIAHLIRYYAACNFIDGPRKPSGVDRIINSSDYNNSTFTLGDGFEKDLYDTYHWYKNNEI